MIRIDFARASSSTGSILRARPSTRVVAPLHQCLSHMSHMMIAVLSDGIVCSKAAGVHSLAFLNGCTQVRSVRCISTLLTFADKFRKQTHAMQSVSTTSKQSRAVFIFTAAGYRMRSKHPGFQIFYSELPA